MIPTTDAFLRAESDYHRGLLNADFAAALALGEGDRRTSRTDRTHRTRVRRPGLAARLRALRAA